MVEVKNLYKKYGDFVALDDLNFDVADGEVFGFVGPNGAGKTTTMRIMAGLNQPDRGSITIAGTDAVKNSKKIKRIIGYMPDFFGVYDNLKVIEYMEFYASIYGIIGSASEKLCQNLLELVDLADKSEFFVDELSRGMKQRLCLARCLVHDPKLLILDEPASGLDPRARLEIQDILKRLKDKKKTLIISSHILHDLTELCTSVGVIDQGKMLVKGNVDGGDKMMIRDAKEKDIPRILKLLEQVLQIHADIRPDIFIPGTTKYTIDELREILKNKEKPIFVAVDEADVCVGYAFCQLQEQPVSNNMVPFKSLYIDDLCVDQEVRGQHIGESLFEHVKKEAKQRGCYEVTLNVWTGNTSAEKFYERMGMRTKKRQMEYTDL